MDNAWVYQRARDRERREETSYTLENTFMCDDQEQSELNVPIQSETEIPQVDEDNETWPINQGTTRQSRPPERMGLGWYHQE